MWLNYICTKIVLPLTMAAVMLGLANVGHGAQAATPPRDDAASADTRIGQLPANCLQIIHIVSDWPDPSLPGQPFIVTFTISSPVGWTGGSVTVTVSPGGAQCTGALTSGYGECSLVIADPGDYTLTAAYSGAENDPICPDTEAHTVIQAETSIALISDLPDPSLPGQPFTMTFKVTSIWGTPTGTVTVTASENGPGCTGLLKAGSGSCPLTLTEAGKYTLTATYLGDEFNLASADSGPHNVKGKTTTSLPDPPHPSLPGQPFTVTFSVASAWGTPTGAVTVTALGSDASCSGELVGGSGSCSLALAQPGEYNLLAAYPGDEGHFASRYIKPHTVSRIHVYLPVTVK